MGKILLLSAMIRSSNVKDFKRTKDCYILSASESLGNVNSFGEHCITLQL